MDIRPVPANMTMSNSQEGNKMIETKSLREQLKSALAQDQQNDRNYSITEMHDMVEGANQFFDLTYTNIRFHFHETLDRNYVEVINADTEETIREVPPEKFLDLVAKLHEMAGLIVDEQL